MGKRSTFERRARDFYPTPAEAVTPLLPHLFAGTRYCEPCAGDGALIDHLAAAGHVCASAWDIEPQRADIARHNALHRLIGNIDCFITNPPWDRRTLHPLIAHLSDQHPTWLLFDADWIHTRQSAPFMARLRRVVSVGRVKWIPGSAMTGKDNCAWHLFDKPSAVPAALFGRLAA
ncbi:MAG: hypothetical protein ACOYBT_10015 [Polynucleobacter sp.]